MTRLEKKCFLFSAGMHGLLLGVLVMTSAFRSEAPPKETQLLTMIPANIIDGETSHIVGQTATPSPTPPQPAPQPVQAQLPTPTPPQPTPHIEKPLPEPPKPVVHHEEPVEPPKPIVERHHEPEISTEPAPKPVKKIKEHKEIVPTFQEASTAPHKPRKPVKPTETTADPAETAANDRVIRSKAIARALSSMAKNFHINGAPSTAVEMPGQETAGVSFASYNSIIYSAFYNAWVAPDSLANRLAAADVKIVVARDGTILSAEIINKSGESALDKSVDRALRSVPRLPPFPAGAHEEQRSFLIRFTLESKESSG